MAASITKIRLNATEYSRYSNNPDNDLRYIKYRVDIGGSIDTGTTMRVELVQEANGEVVCTKLYTVSSSITDQISLVADCFDTAYLTANPIQKVYRAKQGWYHLLFTIFDSSNNIIAEQKSNTFAISIVATSDLKRQNLFGFPGLANDVYAPVQQPRLVTGVTIKFISENFPLGAYQLLYDSTAHTLQITDPMMRDDLPTPKIVLDTNNDNTYMLEGPLEGDYIMVNVSAWSLPTSNQTEEIIIDRQYMVEDAYREFVWQATDYIEGRLITPLEPTRYTSNYELDPLAHIGDAPPVTFYPQKFRNQLMQLYIPKTPIITLDALRGQFNTDTAFNVPVAWRSFNPKSGLVQFTPRKGSLTTWQFTSVNSLQFAYGSQSSVPQFWHYAATVGLNNLTGGYEIVRELIIKRAMANILVILGTAYRGGVSSESVSKEGASTATGFTSSASLGAYGSDVTAYNEFLEKEIPLLRQRIKGVIVRTMD